jgi:DNA-binding response OmpR family regulator
MTEGANLVVEDDRNQRGIKKTILSKEGFNDRRRQRKNGGGHPQERKFDVNHTDLKLPDIDGTKC